MPAKKENDLSRSDASLKTNNLIGFYSASLTAVLTFGLAILVAGCTVAPSPIPTATFIPSRTPVPTPTNIPTKTPDPNMPEGANAGKDGRGRWMRLVNGTRYYFKELHINNEENNVISGWFTSHILDGPYNLDGGIPLALDKYNYPIPSIPFYFNFIEGVKGPFLIHPKQVLEDRVADFQHLFMSELIGRYYRNPYTRRSGPSYEEYIEFLEKFKKSEISFPFVTHTGSFVWKPGPNTGYEFYVIPWDEADPAKHPEFYQTHFFTGLKGDLYLYRWTLYADHEGNLICIGAVKDPNALTSNQFFTWIFDPVVAVLVDYSMPDVWKLANFRKDENRGLEAQWVAHFGQGHGDASPIFTIEPAP